ncbi:hypothetical protein Goshw_004007, partial [Gossypium schwendimanii]|nr:hypothetical protein [Gossypium schwendimanii]
MAFDARYLTAAMPTTGCSEIELLEADTFDLH